MKLIIGNTGLIGTTLKEGLNFDYEFNSKNIQNLSNLTFKEKLPDLYLSCLPATKWKINQDPVSDFLNIIDIIEVVTKHEYGTIVLYSTIDIYNSSPLKSNEDYIPNIDQLNYGNNRFLFERLIKNLVKYKKLIIIRLPALFGKHIKKNIIYDLLNNNQIEKINYNSSYQWYNLDKLIDDTKRYINNTKNKHNYINIFPEPIKTSDILSLFDIDKTKVNSLSPSIIYDYSTKFSETGYTESAESVLKQLKNFIIQNKH